MTSNLSNGDTDYNVPLDIRPYQSADRDPCLALFDANLPGGFFAPYERDDYITFLDELGSSYYVIDHEGAVVGAGGFEAEEHGSIVSLRWGMIAPEFHRRGLGRLLLMYRLREIAKLPGVSLVRMDTSQHSAPFFEKQGFRIVAIKKDGYAPGLDRIEMSKRLEVCAS